MNSNLTISKDDSREIEVFNHKPRANGKMSALGFVVMLVIGSVGICGELIAITTIPNVHMALTVGLSIFGASLGLGSSFAFGTLVYDILKHQKKADEYNSIRGRYVTMIDIPPK